MKEFSHYSLVQMKINERKEQGFTSLRYPGGTSKDGSYYAGVIIYKYDEESKQVYFLCVPYDSEYHKTHPNGHNKKYGEKPEETAVREVQEETDMHIDVTDIELIITKSTEDNKNKGTGKIHFQHFYLLENVPINYHIPEYEGRNGIDGETTAPIWVPAKLFIDVIFGRHRDVAEKVIKKLRLKNIDYTYALMGLV